METEGIPEGCVLSVRAGATRRQAGQTECEPCAGRPPSPSSQAPKSEITILSAECEAPVSSDRPFRFNCTAAEATPFKARVSLFFRAVLFEGSLETLNPKPPSKGKTTLNPKPFLSWFRTVGSNWRCHSCLLRLPPPPPPLPQQHHHYRCDGYYYNCNCGCDLGG